MESKEVLVKSPL